MPPIHSNLKGRKKLLFIQDKVENITALEAYFHSNKYPKLFLLLKFTKLALL